MTKIRICKKDDEWDGMTLSVERCNGKYLSDDELTYLYDMIHCWFGLGGSDLGSFFDMIEDELEITVTDSEEEEIEDWDINEPF